MSKRLALVIHALYGGGAERLMSQLAARWSQQGHDVHLITLAHVSTDQYRTTELNRVTERAQDVGRVHRYGLDLMQPSTGCLSGLKANWERVRSLRRLLVELSPDFILSFCDRMNITTISAAASMPQPLWIAEHSDPARQRLGLVWETWRQWAYRRLVKREHSGCVVLTEAIANTFEKRFRGLKLKVIPPAIELNERIDAAAKGPSFKTDPLGRESFQLLSMGRHSPEKNLDGLLRAWSLIHDKFLQWRLVLAGDGPEHENLKQLAQQLQIDRSIHFAGWVSDPWSLYRQSNLLAMTSHYEGVPVAMLEAMGAGVPCVSTPCSTSVSEFARLGAVDLAASTEPGDIARVLSVAMADEMHRRQLAERGRLMAQRFGWNEIGPRWDELLSKLA